MDIMYTYLDIVLRYLLLLLKIYNILRDKLTFKTSQVSVINHHLLETNKEHNINYKSSASAVDILDAFLLTKEKSK